MDNLTESRPSTSISLRQAMQTKYKRLTTLIKTKSRFLQVTKMPKKCLNPIFVIYTKKKWIFHRNSWKNYVFISLAMDLMKKWHDFCLNIFEHVLPFLLHPSVHIMATYINSSNLYSIDHLKSLLSYSVDAIESPDAESGGSGKTRKPGCQFTSIQSIDHLFINHRNQYFLFISNMWSFVMRYRRNNT